MKVRIAISAHYLCSESVPVLFFPCSETVQSRWSDTTHVYLARMCDGVLVLEIKSRGQGLGRDAYKARSLTPPSPEKTRVCREAVALDFCSFYIDQALFGSPGQMSKTLQSGTMDPTKMGVGRSIAVLTSGGDAQGKRWVVPQ